MMRTKYKVFLPILTTQLQMYLSLNFLDICLLLKMLKHLSELPLYFSSLIKYLFWKANINLWWSYSVFYKYYFKAINFDKWIEFFMKFCTEVYKNRKNTKTQRIIYRKKRIEYMHYIILFELTEDINYLMASVKYNLEQLILR